ncbi:MAG: serine/threonine protein kinase [Clostridia bacterium]|nr:serine/threonine protein kinase [Clostridia bacterium]
MAKVGTIIGGQYEILKQIGHGGMSTVYLGMGKRLGKNWAIKEAKKGDTNSNAARFFEATPIEEANFLKDLHHKNIVSVTDIIEQDGYTYIVEEYLPGQDLEEKMKAGPSPVKDVVHWGVQVCDALDYLHARNIIYRDMKPANVRLDAEGDRVILMDFGIAKRLDPANPADKYKVGTKGYAPQEQFQGMTDQRSDIYSLGITLKALLLGISPYEPAFNDPRSASRIQGENGDGLLRVLNKATNPDPAKRYQTAAAFGKAIKNYEQISTRYKAKLKKQRNTFLGFAIAAVVSLLVAVGCTIALPVIQHNALKNIADSTSYSEIEKAFDVILPGVDVNKEGKEVVKPTIKFGNQETMDAAANIVDILENPKDIEIFETCLQKYYQWAELAKLKDISDKDYTAIIKHIYEDVGRTKDINNAIMKYACLKAPESSNEPDPAMLSTYASYTNDLNDEDKKVKQFFTELNKFDDNYKNDNLNKYKDTSHKEVTNGYKELENYQTYLNAKTDSLAKEYSKYHYENLKTYLSTLCDAKIDILEESE